ncbi:exoribonuclease 2 [Candidatus Photodesmus blepharus]|uniref:Exoribonuclease II n=1 Tax=Candidatus Photodesmus blepharonis TaxID=1179155 RepID=A0A084CPA0_9GAMM|nr:exoribonuclease II [Candidatus Photodesmus blepharus]KEY91629.1 exoribonuclease 2 [Candidatus Photodesmus blepharus]
MFQNNFLLVQLKKEMQENLPKKEGTIKDTGKGFGFLKVGTKTDIFIPPQYMKKCMHGDRVVAIFHVKKNTAEPQKLIKQSLKRFIGRIRKIKKKIKVVPNYPQFTKQFLNARVKKGLDYKDFFEGDWVLADLIRHPLKGDDGFLVEISEKITHSRDQMAQFHVILAQNGLSRSEPATLDQWTLKDDEDLSRVDMTGVPFVTIDSLSTKDIDDALYAKKTNFGTFELTIAIADPTAYITPEDSIDKIARERGFTVYLPGYDIPMLPRNLSDNLCSLVENEIRPALCCKIIVKNDGEIENVKFFAAHVQSHARLVYEQVSDWIETGKSKDWKPTNEISAVIRDLYELSQIRANWRRKKAIIFPDQTHYRFELNEENNTVTIHCDTRRSANRLVEESMVTANICAGKILQSSFSTGIFNTHAGFKAEQVADVVKLVSLEKKFPYDPKSIITLEGFIALYHWLAQQDTSYLDKRIRKFRAYTKITNQPLPHYAMGLDVYATWTSPIRKYGDMINHRMLKAYIMGKDPVQIPNRSICQELALCRKHHRVVERSIISWLYTLALSKALRERSKFVGEIFDINQTGMNTRLLKNGATVFVPSILIVEDKERIRCDVNNGIIYIDEKLSYRLGDMVTLVLTKVDQDSFRLVAKPVIDNF